MTLFTYDSDEAEHKTIENLICSTLNDPDFAGNTHPAITSLKCITSDTAFPGIVPNNDLNKVDIKKKLSRFWIVYSIDFIRRPNPFPLNIPKDIHHFNNTGLQVWKGTDFQQ